MESEPVAVVEVPDCLLQFLPGNQEDAELSDCSLDESFEQEVPDECAEGYEVDEGDFLQS